MVWIPGGTFRMGSTDPLARPDESPIHTVRVDGFWMDATEVTNAQFAEFVKATGYNTIAERGIDWEEMKKQVPPGTPKPPQEELAPGSLVFSQPAKHEDAKTPASWWAWVPGASWKHPEGPGSSIDARQDHPVVHIAYPDAVAYSKWAGKQLPTEAQWEYAARGGLMGKVNSWGDEPVDPTRCNTWQGEFPYTNTSLDGHAGAAPVKSFAANGFGLYDMAGNVWEWCSDLYHMEAYSMRVATPSSSAVPEPERIFANPLGPDVSYDPRNPHEPTLRVIRGGSFLCHDSYCASYRPSARMATSPDTSLSHTGFRCVLQAPAAPLTSPTQTLPLQR